MSNDDLPCLVLPSHYDTGNYLIVIRVPVVPYVRQNRGTQFRQDAKGRAAKRYEEFKSLIRDSAQVSMNLAGIEQMEGYVHVRGHIDVPLAAYDTYDLDNAIKSLGDALFNGVLTADDRCIKHWDVQLRVGEAGATLYVQASGAKTR